MIKKPKIRIKKNVSLEPFSTFRIGGWAEFFCTVENAEEIIETIQYAKAKKLKWRIFAGGSNVVFSDKPQKGLFIRIFGGRIKWEGNQVFLDPGILLDSVVKSSISRGFKGLEALSGIPGTIGGAVFGNAGAYGKSVSQVVEKVEIWDPAREKRRWISKNQCVFKYRESILKKKLWILLQIVLRLEKGEKKKLKETSKRIISARLKKYPPTLKSPGSFFKNVIAKDISKIAYAKIDTSKIIDGKIPAGYLLEAVGAKGMRVGDVYVATCHGNLILNKGKGATEDVQMLSRILKRKVKQKFGIELEEEVRYI